MKYSLTRLICMIATAAILSACDGNKPATAPVAEAAKVVPAAPVDPVATATLLEGKKPVGAGIIADMVREGDLAVGKDFTMALGGRFHHIHTKLMAIKCATCHDGVKFPDNIQFLRREEFPLAAYPGAVDRGTCMGCHRGEGSLATRIYGVSPK